MQPDDLEKREFARHELQRAQLVAMTDPQEALATLRRAEAYDPKNEEVLLALGRVQLRLGQRAEAVNSLRQLLVLSPGHAEGGSLLAFAHRQLGHWSEARRLAGEAVQRNPNDLGAREVLADCLVSEKDWGGALRELDQLTPVVADHALVRITKKAAFCSYHLGAYQRVFKDMRILLRNGWGDEGVQQLYDMAQEHKKEEVRRQRGELPTWKRFFLSFFDTDLAEMMMDGETRGMDRLRVRHAEASQEAERLREAAEIHERRASEAEREKKTDLLTGLPNGRCLDEDYKAKFDGPGPIGVIALDLDKFKLINDFHGHDGGDRALRKFGAVAADTFRHPQSNVFRVGGEEFVALVFGDQAATLKLAEHFRAELERRGASELAAEGMALKMRQDDGQVVDRLMTASLGVAMYPFHGSDYATVFKKADDAAYASKRAGRNRLIAWDSSIPSQGAIQAETAPQEASLTMEPAKRVAMGRATARRRPPAAAAPDSEAGLTVDQLLAQEDLAGAGAPGSTSE